MKTYIPIVLDTIFVAFISFLLLLLPIVTAISNKTIAIIISVLLSLVITLPSFFIIRKIKLKNLKKLTDVTQKKNILYMLNYKTTKELNDIFFTILQSYNPVIKNDTLYLQTKNCLVKYIFRFNNINDDDIFNLIKENYKKDNILILSNSENTPNIIKNIQNVHFYNATNTYLLLKDYKTLFINEVKHAKKPLKAYTSIFFKKKNALKYFLLGVSSYVLSFFVNIGLYYTIFGGTLLCFSIICLLYPPEKVESKFLDKD